MNGDFMYMYVYKKVPAPLLRSNRFAWPILRVRKRQGNVFFETSFPVLLVGNL